MRCVLCGGATRLALRMAEAARQTSERPTGDECGKERAVDVTDAVTVATAALGDELGAAVALAESDECTCASQQQPQVTALGAENLGVEQLLLKKNRR